MEQELNLFKKVLPNSTIYDIDEKEDRSRICFGEILKVIKYLNNEEELPELKVDDCIVGRNESGIVAIIMSSNNKIKYDFQPRLDKFGKPTWVLAKITEDGESLSSEYQAICIGEEWFTSEDKVFRKELNINDNGVKFDYINLDI